MAHYYIGNDGSIHDRDMEGRSPQGLINFVITSVIALAIGWYLYEMYERGNLEYMENPKDIWEKIKNLAFYVAPVAMPFGAWLGSFLYIKKKGQSGKFIHMILAACCAYGGGIVMGIFLSYCSVIFQLLFSLFIIFLFFAVIAAFF